MASSSAAAPAPRLHVQPTLGASKNWMPGIETLRAFAALAVVAHHCWSLSSQPRFPGYWVIEGFGSFGVNLFFVLSAYLLGGPAAGIRSRADLADFWWRRAARIAPAYYANVLLLFVFFAPTGLLLSSEGARQSLANLTFTQWLWPTRSSSLGVNGVLWTLTIEVLLYLTLPAIAWAWRRLPVTTIAALIVCGIGWRLVVARRGAALRDAYFGDLGVPEALQSLFIARQFLGYLPLFALGFLLRWWLETSFGKRVAARLPAPRPITVVLALIPAMATLVWIERASYASHWVWFSGYDLAMSACMLPALAIATTARPAPAAATFSDRCSEWLGARSYGIYLWHFPVILVAYERGATFAPPSLNGWPIRVAAVIVASLLFAHASYQWIEVPAQRWMRDRLRRDPRGTTA
jgi:peptidoglycan/LPS O-acetylase OafA/YrhL